MSLARRVYPGGRSRAVPGNQPKMGKSNKKPTKKTKEEKKRDVEVPSPSPSTSQGAKKDEVKASKKMPPPAPLSPKTRALDTLLEEEEEEEVSLSRAPSLEVVKEDIQKHGLKPCLDYSPEEWATLKKEDPAKYVEALHVWSKRDEATIERLEERASYYKRKCSRFKKLGRLLDRNWETLKEKARELEEENSTLRKEKSELENKLKQRKKTPETEPFMYWRGVVGSIMGVLTSVMDRLTAMEEKMESLPRIPPSSGLSTGERGPKQAPKKKAKEEEKKKESNTPFLVPPAPTDPKPDSWSRVVGRREKRGARQPPSHLASTDREGTAKKKGIEGRVISLSIAKASAPRSEAVLLSSSGEGSLPIGELYKKIIAEVKFKTLGIFPQSLDLRRSASGGLLVEVSGEDAVDKADALADKIKGVIEGPGVKVTRPSTKGTLLVQGLMEGIFSPAGVAEALAKATSCRREDVWIGLFRPCRGGNRKLPCKGSSPGSKTGKFPTWLDFSTGGSPRQRPTPMLPLPGERARGSKVPGA